jgi:hypothetical protein
MEKMKIELLQEHEHAGLVCPIGAMLELDADAAQRLIEIGHARSAELQTRKPKPKQED